MSIDTRPDSIRDVVGGRIDLPSAPIVIQRLHSLVATDEAGSREIAAIVETDQAFTARILKLVNSPFYGFARQITSVEEAVTMLGMNAVHQLLLTTSVLDTLRSGSSALNATEFWKHSFGVGAIAKRLLTQVDAETQGEALSCGILHDIGRLLLLRADEKKFATFYRSDEAAFDCEAEKAFFGIDHQELGGLLAEKWNFPSGVTQAIRFHHSPELTKGHLRLVSAVNVANMICHAMSVGDSCNHYVTDFSSVAWKELDLRFDEIETAIRLALADIDQAGRTLMEVR